MDPQPGADIQSWSDAGWGNLYTGTVDEPPAPQQPQQQPLNQAPSYLELIAAAARQGATVNPNQLVGW